MTLPNLTIRRAVHADAAAIARVVSTACAGLDVCRWLVPDDGDRVPVLADYVRLTIDHAITCGTVETVIDRSAVAVWLPSSALDIPHREAMVAAVCGDWAPRFHRLETAMRQAHPTDRGDHHYLALLAVLPQRQNQGVGSALLANRLAVLDHADRPSYLAAGSRRVRKMYRRRGYTDCGRPLRLPYTGDPLFPMWRAAQAAARHRHPSGAVR